MNTNDQPHAEVTEDIKKGGEEIRWGCYDDGVYRTAKQVGQWLADFCAKREAFSALLLLSKDTEIKDFHARESLHTASNEDLAAQCA